MVPSEVHSSTTYPGHLPLKFLLLQELSGGVVYLGNGNLGSIVDKFHGCLSVIFSIYLGGGFRVPSRLSSTFTVTV